MDQATPQTDIRARLTPVLPEGQLAQKALDDEAARRLHSHWERLAAMGFDLELRRDSLRVQHRNRRFETVIHLSHEKDLGERRALFRALKSAFGRVTDRLFSWAFQPSSAVAAPYESLREVISICQSVRRRFRFSD
jgi:hypothetical protein